MDTLHQPLAIHFHRLKLGFGHVFCGHAVRPTGQPVAGGPRQLLDAALATAVQAIARMLAKLKAQGTETS